MDAHLAAGLALAVPLRLGQTRRSLALAALSAITCVIADPVAHAESGPAALADKNLIESSGLAVAADGSVLWTIQDSGNAPDIFATDDTGAALGAWPVSDAENVDWEDLSLIPNAAGGMDLLIADIGDNSGKRDDITLYRVPQPDLAHPGEPLPASATTLAYPDHPHDAEAVLVHPVTGETLILTKELWSDARIFQVMWQPNPRLEQVGSVDGPGIGPFGRITGGAVSPDGAHAALLTYSGIAEWDVAPGETLVEALRRAPRILRSPKTGLTEAIAYAADGATLYVTTEGEPGYLASIALDPSR
ncbi:MAG: hypothetical protein ACR2J8_15420 [Thermomicrobiales bacterium]